MSSLRKSPFALLFFALIPIFLLSACSPQVKFEQPYHPDMIPLAGGVKLGQTFTSRYAGLQGIAIFMAPNAPGDGELVLSLRKHPEDHSVIAFSNIPVGQITSPAFYKFWLEVQPDSARQDYYLSLELNGGGEIQVGTAPGDTYLNGALYSGELPQDRQMAFRLIHQSETLYSGLVREGMLLAGLVVISILLFIIPGWGILCLFLPEWAPGPAAKTHLSFGDKLGLSASFSLVIYPLLYLWTDTLGVHLGVLYTYLPPIIGFIAIVWAYRARIQVWFQQRQQAQFEHPKSNPSTFFTPSHFFDVLLLFILCLLFISRFWPIRTLAFPLWGDSYQHTMIAQLLVDNKGIFQSWAPYADQDTFTYHFGFHTLVVALQTITRISMPLATLWTGQLVNVIAVLSLYPLATRISRGQWAGIAAIVIAGFLTVMPMFYVNWGRYTQLTGQALLAATAYLTWIALEKKLVSWRNITLAGFAFAGLALSHFRILFFGILLLPAYLLVYIRKNNLRDFLVRSIAISLISALLFLPWFINVFGGRIMALFRQEIATPLSEVTQVIPDLNTIGNLFDYLPALIWLLLPLAIGWGLWYRQRSIALISLWWFMILIAANPQWLGLPGAAIISGFAVMIAAYMPASLILSAAFQWVIERSYGYAQLEREDRPSSDLFNSFNVLAPYLAALFLVLLAFWGARQRISDVQPDTHGLVTHPDQRAFEWIKTNLPPDAGLLVNTFPAFYGSTIVGSDAGWWLPLITGHQTNLPPITYNFEREPWPGYQDWINSLTYLILDKGVDHPEVLAELENRGLDYVFIGQQQGSVNYDGPSKLDPEQLLASPDFTPVYHQDRVWIFKIE